MKITDLKTEYLTDPQAIDSPTPRLSWSIKAEPGDTAATAILYQESYRILVASSEKKLAANEGDLWDSGFVMSNETAQIEYAGKMLIDRQDCFWKVKLIGTNGLESEWSETAHWRMGIFDWIGKFIWYNHKINTVEGELTPPVALGKSVKIKKRIRRATLYITALGLFNVYINGEEFPGTILAPEWTNYFKRCQYRTLDLTNTLKKGKNDLIVLLANGWYSGVWQAWPPHPYTYGKHPELCAQLELEYTDGSHAVIGTDASWKASENIPVTFAGIYEGETIDGRITIPSVDEMELEVSVNEECTIERNAQKNEPITILRRIAAKTVSEPVPGIYVADFGENIAGRIRVRLYGKRAQKVEIFHNEVLNPDGTVYKDNLIAGHFVENADRQIVRYICRGDMDGEICRPTFTYMGFRYLEITGLDKAPTPDDIEAEVFGSDIRLTSTFTCSNQEINQLQENIIRSCRANFMGVPTDCPQRDERCGYTGDMQFFLPTALQNFSMEAFMAKWLVDLCQDTQSEDGRYADHAPWFGVSAYNVAWGDAGIICPYLVWKEYGDIHNIRCHFDAMERYLNYLCRTANADYTRGPELCGNGDWLHNGGGASHEIIATAYFAYAAAMMAEMSLAIQKYDRAQYYHELALKIKNAFAENYINPDGSITGAGVTGYALAFTMDLLPDDETIRTGAANAFAKAVEAADCRITTGFIGTPRLLIALHRIDRDDLAERLLMCRECPSWLYPITVGATTIWERFNGWTEEDGYADSGMNSFNHFAFGSVGDYFFDGILGISHPDSSSDRIVRISPAYLNSLESASGTRRIYNSEIAVSWKRREDNKVILKVTVGANLNALVHFGGEDHFCPCGEYIFEE